MATFNNGDSGLSVRTKINSAITMVDSRGACDGVSASGTNTYTATLNPAITSYVAYQTFRVLFVNSNTGASTINFNSLGALTLKKANGQALQSGDIVANTIYTVTLIDTSNAQIDVAAGQQGTWSPAFTGFSSDPSGITARYNTYDNLCWVHFFPATPGTSNGTGFTITLPFAAANTAIQYWPIMVINNGAIQLGRLATAANSNIATLSSAIAGTGWTASGNKSAFFTLVYEIAV